MDINHHIKKAVGISAIRHQSINEDFGDWIDKAKKVTDTVSEKASDVSDAARSIGTIGDQSDNSATKAAKTVANKTKDASNALKNIGKLFKK